MELKITRPIERNSNLIPKDIKEVKLALNRLGYYKPHKDIGITDISDNALFSSLKRFQKKLKLKETGILKPDDETIKEINNKISKNTTGKYIWRTVDDKKVRNNHASLNGTIRSWDISPVPGEEHNCRCWAELVENEIEKENLPPLPDIEPKIPGTDIPDRGIPEEGYPNSSKYDPYRPSNPVNPDPELEIYPPLVDPKMPIFDPRNKRLPSREEEV